MDLTKLFVTHLTGYVVKKDYFLMKVEIKYINSVETNIKLSKKETLYIYHTFYYKNLFINIMYLYLK